MAKSKGSGFVLDCLGFKPLAQSEMMDRSLNMVKLKYSYLKMRVIIVPSSSVNVRLQREKAPSAHTGCQAHNGLFKLLVGMLLLLFLITPHLHNVPEN